MDMERINPAGLARPSGFSHAVSAPAGPDGVPGRPARRWTGTGGSSPAASWRSSSRRWATCSTALAAAGGQPSDLVSLTIYLTDVADYQAHAREIGAVWRRLAGTDYPAMAAVGVTRLWLPELLVEIQGIAVVSG